MTTAQQIAMRMRADPAGNATKDPSNAATKDPTPSPDARRTARQRAALAAGRHPTGLGPVDREHNCGTCAHHLVNRRAKRTFHKCEFTATLCAATDIRVSWPACPRWEERTDG